MLPGQEKEQIHPYTDSCGRNEIKAANAEQAGAEIAQNRRTFAVKSIPQQTQVTVEKHRFADPFPNGGEIHGNDQDREAAD
ncbi:hypothetical protein D3C75_1338180 [compost metagenome]